MVPEMTPAVERAVEAARRYASAGGEVEVRPWHLLAGLLEEEEGRAALRACSAGLDVGAFLGRARAGGGAEGSGEGLPLHPLSARALAEARRLAAGRTGERTADGESLLLALLHADEGARA